MADPRNLVVAARPSGPRHPGCPRADRPPPAVAGIALALVLTLPAVTAEAGVDRWSPIAPPGGDVADLVVDPSRPAVLYAVTGAPSPYKSVDGGGRWVAIGRGLPRGFVSAFALDPGAPDFLYLSAGTFLGSDDWEFFRSADGGVSWSRVDGGGPPVLLFDLAVAPAPDSTLYGVGTTDPLHDAFGLYRSRDGGESWQRVRAAESFFQLNEVVVDPRAPRTVYLATADGVLRSLDGGDTWSALGQLADGSALGRVERIATAPGDASVHYASRFAFAFRSADGGQTWSPRPFPDDAGCGFGSLVVDPGDDATVWAACSTGVLLSRDGGATWSRRDAGIAGTDGTGPGVNVLAIDPGSPEVLYAGTDPGGVFKTTTGGDGWFPTSRGIAESPIDLLAFDPTSPDVVYARRAGDPCGAIAVSADAGRSWSPLTPVPECLEEPVLAISPNDSSRLFLGHRRGLWVSADGGASWRRRFTGPVNSIALDPRRPRTLLLGGSGIHRSRNGGGRWVEVLAGRPSGMFRSVLQVLVDPVHPGAVFARGLEGTTGGADLVGWRSADDGATWQGLSGPFGSYPPTLQSAPGPGGAVFTGQEDLDGPGPTAWWRTADGGATWEALAVPGSRLLVVPAQPYLLYTDDGASILRSEDGGGSWQVAGDWSGCDRSRGILAGASGLAPDLLFAYRCAGTLSTAELVGAGEVELLGGRFAARGAWRDEQGRSRPAVGAPLSDLVAGFSRTADETPENLVKVLDARGFDGRFWVFAAGLSRGATGATLTDRETGLSRDFNHPAGPPASSGDFATFPPFPEAPPQAAGGATAPPPVTAASAAPGVDPAVFAQLVADDACAADPAVLCLQDGRFRAVATWLLPDRGGVGEAIPLGDDGGAFWFFREPNVEVAVRVTAEDAEPGRLRVVWGSLTTLAYSLAVLDTTTGEVRSFAHSAGAPESGEARGAFPG